MLNVVYMQVASVRRKNVSGNTNGRYANRATHASTSVTATSKTQTTPTNIIMSACNVAAQCGNVNSPKTVIQYTRYGNAYSI